MIDFRDNIRVLLLLFLCILAGLALFGPLGASGQEFTANNADLNNTFEEDTVSDPTNLQYGLELSGGARIRGQLVGITAEGVQIDDERAVENTVAEELDLEPIDVQARPGEGTVELYSRNATQSEFATALGEAGLDVTEGDIREGVTSQTRSTAVEILTERLDQTGLSGANVGTVSAATGENFVFAEAPSISLEQLKSVASDTGRVQVVAGYPEETENGTVYRTEAVLEREDFAGIDNAQPREEGEPPRVPVSLSDQAAQRYASTMQETGFTGEGVGSCFFNPEEHDQPDQPNTEQYCLFTVVDGEYVYGAQMSQGLADTINSGQFVNDPRFVLTTGSFQDAQDLQINLRAGALPTELEVQSETFVSPSLAQVFKPLALLTGILAWLTVSAVVYFWYRDVRVAVPMLLTATSEVFLLLGFAAAIGIALNLSHIAGLIAVIGTGLDDLLIMADEILQRRDKVKTGRIFQNRFRKAFWVIGMAAATTIIAMSPLAVLSLGELRGFAIITIVGVLIGVGITRPAYGDVLRQLMLDDVKRN